MFPVESSNTIRKVPFPFKFIRNACPFFYSIRYLQPYKNNFFCIFQTQEAIDSLQSVESQLSLPFSGFDDDEYDEEVLSDGSWTELLSPVSSPSPVSSTLTSPVPPPSTSSISQTPKRRRGIQTDADSLKKNTILKHAFETMQKAAVIDEFDTVGQFVASSMREWSKVDKELTEDFRENLYATVLEYQIKVRASGKAQAATQLGNSTKEVTIFTITDEITE